jgi:hypothetical protein
MNHWMQHLECLAIRFSDLGVTSDLASMTIVELWAVYRFLKRLAGD